MRVKVSSVESWEDAWSKGTANTYSLSYPCICRESENFNAEENSSLWAQIISIFFFYSFDFILQPEKNFWREWEY